MQYRREVDGLRTIAVLPVILGHAGYVFFHGGFVGVDVFFVISGYLVTTIIMNDLDGRKFSILKFYERRARRILPTLFMVMGATVPFAYLWMMPDEFKNYGQSLVATSLFSNNILLLLTSNYWSLDSSFKPLLHTWSLGVEEQYYIIFPFFLMVLWKYLRRHVFHVMGLLFVLSLASAIRGELHFPTMAFYILPTRGWELLAGVMVAYWLKYRAAPTSNGLLQEAASLAGLAMIAFAVVVFDDSYPSPGPWILFPVAGAVLIIAFAVEGTLAHRLLASRVMVGIGMISYSLYLWHQPLFALARVHAVDPLRPQVYALLIAATFVLAYLTWRFVEAPFRSHQFLSRQTIVMFSFCGSLCAIGFGLYLDNTYGMYWRVYNKNEKIADLDKRIYNSRVFEYKKDQFGNDGRRHVFVIGNSFGRDFINMTTETFDTRDIEFAYSDTAETCIDHNPDLVKKSLFEGSDIIVFANIYQPCVANAIAWANEHKKKIFFVGTKDFGYNLNWIIQLPPAARANQYNQLPDFARIKEQIDMELVPAANFISLLEPVMKNGMVPITDDQGRMISTDRKHLTKFGAIFFGEHALKPTAYGALLAGNGAK
jgi:peptidoglycan/LPS O-acetylase OafA/YrhL